MVMTPLPPPPVMVNVPDATRVNVTEVLRASVPVLGVTMPDAPVMVWVGLHPPVLRLTTVKVSPTLPVTVTIV